MTTKILAPHYLRIEREVRGDIQSVWNALTDVHELRAWWALPVCDFEPNVGGGFELRYIGRERLDKFVFTTWDKQWRIGGFWTYNWLDGRVEEMISLKEIGSGVCITIEHTNFQSYGSDAGRIFGYHKTETRARLERLRDWIEQRVPANMAKMPLV